MKRSPRSFTFKVERSDDNDVTTAIAAWRLAWAERIILGEIDEEGRTEISVYLYEGWEKGPSGFVAWVNKMTGPKEKRDEA